MRLPAGSLSPQARKPTARSIISSKSSAFDHAVMLEDRAIGGVRAGERGGVRGDRAASRLGLADLGDDQRLAGAERLVGDAAEFLRRLHVFEQQQKDVGLAFVEHVVEQVGRFERGFVAGGDDVAERRDCARARGRRRQSRGRRFARSPTPGRCRAGAPAERAGAHVHRRAEGRAERGGDIGEAFGVGPAHRHVVARARSRGSPPACARPLRPAPRQSRSTR